MIVYCATCKTDTIARKIGARCSWCDSILIRACACCGGAVYPKRQRGPKPIRCATCRTLRRSIPRDDTPAAA